TAKRTAASTPAAAMAQGTHLPRGDLDGAAMRPVVPALEARPPPVARSLARSRVDSYRSVGSLARHRSMIQDKGAGVSGRSDARGSGSSRMTAVIVSAAEAPRNGRLPVRM